MENAAGLRSALTSRAWDIVLADYALPQFSGSEALDVVKKTGLDIPVILVSGTIGEEIAIAAMRGGRRRLHHEGQAGSTRALHPAGGGRGPHPGG